MKPVSSEAIQQLFTQSRSYSSWLPNAVSNETLESIYDLMKWGPTSANLCPVRIVFVKSEVAKQQLISTLSPGNIEKVRSAPVTAIIAQDMQFYDKIDILFPHMVAFKEMFLADEKLAQSTAFRNSSLQGAYFMLAARALGLDCGPMSGFDNAKLDALFFEGTSWRSNFICNLGYGDRSNTHTRLPRLSFEQACIIK